MRNDFPPLLVRRYELRILPIGRRGSLFPFQDQNIPHTSMNTPPAGVSLRHVRSRNIVGGYQNCLPAQVLVPKIRVLLLVDDDEGSHFESNRISTGNVYGL